MDDWRIGRLGLERGHAREGFDREKLSLNDFLVALASPSEKRNLGRTYVAVQEEDPRVLDSFP